MRGSIIKRKGSKGALYYVVIRGRWYKLPGRQTKQNAETYRAQLVVEAARGALVGSSTETVAAFVERWRAARLAELAPATRVSYNNALDAYVLPALGTRSIATVSREDIEVFFADLRARRAPRTVNTIGRIVKTLFRAAVSWHYIARSPAESVRNPIGDAVREARFLEPGEIRALLEDGPAGEGDPDHWRAVFHLAITAGLRCGEVAAAAWADLDRDVGRYFVRRSYTYTPEFKGARSPKTAGSRAGVVVTPDCLATLERHRARQAATALRLGREPSALLFPGEDGEPMPPRRIQRVFSRALVGAGLEPMRFHDLRHTCAALWIALGESPKFIQTQMRHASISTTFDTYGHLFPARAEAAAGRMDALLKG